MLNRAFLCELTAQICLANLFAGGKLIACTGQDDAAVFQDVRAVGNGQGFACVLLDEKDRRAIAVDILDDIEYLIHKQGG